MNWASVKQRGRAALVAVLALILAAATVVMVADAGRAADESAMLSTAGNDHWLAFPPAGVQSQKFEMTLSITGTADTTGLVEWPDGTAETFTVTANTITTVTAPDSIGDQGDALGTEGTAYTGVHVTAEDAITVYGLSYQYSTSSAFVSLPVSSLGDRYRVMTLENYQSAWPSRLTVLAVEDDTTVEITPSETVNGHTAGVPFTVTLQQGEVYTLASASGTGYDMTGSLVTSDKDVAVYGTGDCVKDPDDASTCDLIVQQMTSTDTWGTTFVAPRYPAYDAGSTVRVLADTDDTTVTVDGSTVATLDAGEVWEGTIPVTTDSSFIETSEPVSVAVFMPTDKYTDELGYDEGTSSYRTVTGDVAMLMISPVEQALSHYTVSTPSDGFAYNGMTLVIPTAATASVTINGAAANLTWTVVGTSDYSMAYTGDLEPGTYVLDASAPFATYVYGANPRNSYAYAGGVGLSPVAATDAITLRAASPVTGYVGSDACIPVSAVDSAGEAVSGVRLQAEVISGPTAGLQLPSVTIQNGTTQFCYEGDATGTDQIQFTVGTASTSASIEWLATDAVAPLSTDPDDVTVEAGSTAFFEVSTSGSPTPSIQWQVATSGDNWVDVAGATSRTLEVEKTTLAQDGDRYRAQLTNTSGVVTTAAATMTVVARPTLSTSGDVTIVADSSTELTATITGSPTPTVQWQISTDGGTTWANVDGASSSTYVTPTLALSDSGVEYRVVAANSVGSRRSVPLTVTVVEAPVVTMPATEVYVEPGNAASVTATVTGTPTLTYQWQQLTGGAWTDVTGATSLTFTTPVLPSATTYGTFRLAATNSSGTTYGAAVDLGAYEVPAVVTNPGDREVAIGSIATMEVDFSGTPAASIQWQHLVSGTWQDIAGATTSTLTFAAADVSDEGQYRAVATNAGGAITSAEATLTVYALPTFTAQPADTVTAVAGSTITLESTATGRPAVTYQWEVSTDGGVTWTEITAATEARYTTSELSADMNGTRYRAVASNAYGSATSEESVLTVLAASDNGDDQGDPLASTGAEHWADAALAALMLTIGGAGAIGAVRRRRYGRL